MEELRNKIIWLERGSFVRSKVISPFLVKDLIESHRNCFDNPGIIGIFGKLVELTSRKKDKE
jgi:hypothetical protein